MCEPITWSSLRRTSSIEPGTVVGDVVDVEVVDVVVVVVGVVVVESVEGGAGASVVVEDKGEVFGRALEVLPDADLDALEAGFVHRPELDAGEIFPFLVRLWIALLTRRRPFSPAIIFGN